MWNVVLRRFRNSCRFNTSGLPHTIVFNCCKFSQTVQYLRKGSWTLSIPKCLNEILYLRHSANPPGISCNFPYPYTVLHMYLLFYQCTIYRFRWSVALYMVIIPVPDPFLHTDVHCFTESTHVFMRV